MAKITTQCGRQIVPSYHAKVVEYATMMANALMLEFGHDFDLHIKTKTGGRSWGGVKGISIADTLSGNRAVYKFTEYSSIADSKTIGTVRGDQDYCIRALVAHEVAHWWHHNLCREQYGAKWGRHPEGRKGVNKPHGQRWQMIYRDLRFWFVNPDTRGINPFDAIECEAA
jgi:hypothetical protein